MNNPAVTSTSISAHRAPPPGSTHQPVNFDVPPNQEESSAMDIDSSEQKSETTTPVTYPSASKYLETTHFFPAIPSPKFDGRGRKRDLPFDPNNSSSWTGDDWKIMYYHLQNIATQNHSKVKEQELEILKLQEIVQTLRAQKPPYRNNSDVNPLSPETSDQKTMISEKVEEHRLEMMTYTKSSADLEKRIVGMKKDEEKAMIEFQKFRVVLSIFSQTIPQANTKVMELRKKEKLGYKIRVDKRKERIENEARARKRRRANDKANEELHKSSEFKPPYDSDSD